MRSTPQTGANYGARKSAARSAAASSPTTVDGKQKIAVAAGLTEILWPTEITTAKVSVLGLE